MAIDGVLRQPPRLRFSRRSSGFLGGLVLCIGVVLLLDALVTVVWQDPLTAVFAQQEQKALSKKLSAAEKAPLSTEHSCPGAKGPQSDPQRMALLAGHLRGRTAAGAPLGRIEIRASG